MVGELNEKTTLRQQSMLRRLHDISIKLLGELELGPLVESIVTGVVEFLEAD
ncbi:MAG: hypothetical protein ACRDFQ_07865 [Anaerolineales bacterium]